ncbi:serine/threonine protein kinase [Actinopolymorpha alba]|uniref:serine/threonine protein kinase n=1 Tax=Actinopolymorpha alba TaxID=533267 RepID=UPI0003AB3E47|nr:serine/threonine-protein kinase [Actinopolymorpha alba]
MGISMQGDFRVEGYDIEGLLGAGPAGEVWLARELSSGTQVALKRLRPRDTDAQDEARRIVSVLGQLAHPQVLPIREMVLYGTEVVFVLEYADGGSLGQLLLARGTLDPGEVVGVASAVATALAAIHQRGLVHADVTPENILLRSDARPLLADVGFLRLVEGGEGGTLGYTDPAAQSDSDPTPAGDVYGLAAVCYAALAGNPPEPGPQHRPLHQVAPGVPPGLAHAIEAGLQSTPAQRPGAAEFGAQLAAACPSAPIRFPDGSMGDADFLAALGQHPSDQGSGAGQSPFSLGELAGPQRGETEPGVAAQDPPPAGSNQPPVFQQGAPGAAPPVSPFPGTTARPVPEHTPDDDDDERDGRRRRGLVLGLAIGAPLALAAIVAVGVVGWRTLAGSTPSDPRVTTGASSAPAVPPESTASATPSAAASARPTSAPRSAAEARWTRVLTTLDQRRAQAWRTWNPQLLSKVYQPGSKALQEELALMQLHEDKNVTSVVGLNTPILSLDVVSESSSKVVVDAVSQLQPYQLELDGQLYPHQGGTPKRFRMTLVPDGSNGWLIASSREIGGVPTTGPAR